MPRKPRFLKSAAKIRKNLRICKSGGDFVSLRGDFPYRQYVNVRFFIVFRPSSRPRIPRLPSSIYFLFSLYLSFLWVKNYPKLSKISLSFFDHIDSIKKQDTRFLSCPAKIEICAKRLEDYHTLRHNTVNVNNIAFDFIYNRHLLAKRDDSHYFPILDR